MINASFKVFWNNPIEMATETSLQELEFNIPLGAIIADPSVSVDLSNYYTKAQTDAVAASKVAQTITHGVTTSAPSQDAVSDALLLKQNLPTGYVQGWELSIDPLDNTKFRIDVGGGIVTNFTDVFNIKPTIVQTTTMLTGLTPQFLATHPASYIAFDKDLNIIQSSSPFTNEDRRTLIILGSVIHSNNLIVNITNEIKAPIIAPTNQLHDFMLAVGALNLEGNIVEPNGANLSINVTAGKLWKFGVSAEDYYNPHIVDLPSRIAPSFSYRTQTSVEYPSTNLLDPTYYDVGGVRTLITNNNRWTVQHIYMFQSGLIRIQYGQTQYTSYANALTELLVEPHNVEANISDNGVLIAQLIIKKTCTNLQQDISNGIASLHTVGKFGSVSGHTAITQETVINALGYTPAPIRQTVNPQSTSYQLQISDANNIVRTTGASATNITVPASTTVAWTPQDKIVVEWYGTGQPTIVAASGVIIRTGGGGTLTLSQRYDSGTLEYVGADEWILHKDDSGGGGSSEPTWVELNTVATIQSTMTNVNIQVARFQGMLWIKGTFSVNTSVAANTEIFRITAQTYKPYAFSTTGVSRLLSTFPCWNLSTTGAKLLGLTALGNITNSTQAATTDVVFEAKSILATSDITLNIPPTIIGMLAY